MLQSPNPVLVEIEGDEDVKLFEVGITIKKTSLILSSNGLCVLEKLL